jgi:hypothetical protein
MGRAKRLSGGTCSTGLAIEYVRTRKVVRILGWMAEAPIQPVEIPVRQLCHDLGIDPGDLGAPQHFLLFAGSHHRTAGGLRDLVGTFDDEVAAWAAFQDLRQAHPSRAGWAELAMIDARGHLTQLAWFGLHQATPTGDTAPPVRTLPITTRPAPGPDQPAYLRALTTS